MTRQGPHGSIPRFRWRVLLALAAALFTGGSLAAATTASAATQAPAAVRARSCGRATCW